MKRTYRYDKKLDKLVEITRQKQGPADKKIFVSDAHYDGLVATDGTDIGTRKKHREYMKQNNLTTMDDFTNSWSEAKESRENYMQNGGTFRREDIARAINEIERK